MLHYGLIYLSWFSCKLVSVIYSLREAEHLFSIFFFWEDRIGYCILEWRAGNVKIKIIDLEFTHFFQCSWNENIDWLMQSDTMIPRICQAMPMVFVPLRAFFIRNGTFLLFDMYLELCVSMYMCEQQLLLSWCLLQTPCLFCIYQGTGRRESSFLKWHISIKKRKVQCVCVCELRVRGWNKLYSTLTGDHFSWSVLVLQIELVLVCVLTCYTSSCSLYCLIHACVELQ